MDSDCIQENSEYFSSYSEFFFHEGSSTRFKHPLVCDYTKDPETMYRPRELQCLEHGKMAVLYRDESVSGYLIINQHKLLRFSFMPIL